LLLGAQRMHGERSGRGRRRCGERGQGGMGQRHTRHRRRGATARRARGRRRDHAEGGRGAGGRARPRCDAAASGASRRAVWRPFRRAQRRPRDPQREGGGPGVFDTRDWSGEVRPGGKWRASGVGGGRPYVLEGEFIEVEAPRRLTHTWTLVGAPEATTNIEYLVEPSGGGARITLRQSRFHTRGACAATCLGWETSFLALREMLG